MIYAHVTDGTNFVYKKTDFVKIASVINGNTHKSLNDQLKNKVLHHILSKCNEIHSKLSTKQTRLKLNLAFFSIFRKKRKKKCSNLRKFQNMHYFCPKSMFEV